MATPNTPGGDPRLLINILAKATNPKIQVMKERYRVTFADGKQIVIATGSVNQAIASAVRNDQYDREIVKVEKWGYAQDGRADIARSLNKQHGDEH